MARETKQERHEREIGASIRAMRTKLPIYPDDPRMAVYHRDHVVYAHTLTVWYPPILLPEGCLYPGESAT